MRPEVAEHVGARLETRRPVGLVSGLLVEAAPGLMLAAAITAARPDLWWLGLVLAPGTWLLLFAVLGEVLMFRHHLHENALVTTSAWPYPTRVVPYYSIDPASIRVAGYHRTDGTSRDSRDKRYRQVPTRPTIRVVGLHPDRATDLARGKAGWNDGPYVPRVLGGRVYGQKELEPVEWVLGWPSGRRHPDPAEDAARLRELVVASTERGYM